MEYEFDGKETFKGLSYTASMGNGCYTGGGIKQTPEAKPNDGLLDIMVVESLNLVKILKAIPLLFTGRLLEHKSVHLYKAKKIKVYKYRQKKKYRRTQGHRQPYTKVEITKVA